MLHHISNQWGHWNWN